MPTWQTLLMGVAMPTLRTYFIPALYGVAGAILANTLIILLLLLLSLGTTVADIAMIWLITLPVPLVLGVLAGVLTRSNGWAFILAIMGIIGGTLSIAFWLDTLYIETWLSLLIRVIGGAIVELMLVGIAALGRYLWNSIRNSTQ